MRVSRIALLLGALAALAAAQDREQVGADTCLGCHPNIGESFAKNAHRALPREGACETCHGPGSAHIASLAVTDILNPAKLAPADSIATCASCHRPKEGHARDQIACANCHTVHGTKEMVPSKPAAINDQCGSCHSTVRAAFARPYTHPLQQNAMSCVDCHDPHQRGQSATSRMVAARNQPSCFNCHGEKRGPFVFEHAPMRTDGCASCHEPHGSANPRMLTRNQQRVVCLECHANVGAIGAPAAPGLGGTPPAIHDLQNTRFQNCSTCHVAVHGSQVHPALLR